MHRCDRCHTEIDIEPQNLEDRGWIAIKQSEPFEWFAFMCPDCRYLR